MAILILFAFIAGIVTILSPCILPILPVVLQGTVAEGKKRPLGIVIGFILSFTFFTLLTSTLVRRLGLDADILRVISIVVIGLFGLTLFVPQLMQLSEKLFTRLSQIHPQSAGKDGLWSGILLGLSIGLLWTPCVGPILAAVISLSFTTTVSSAVFFITLAYAVGTALPMIAIIYLGRSLFTRVPFLFKNLVNIQKWFGFLMILTAVAILMNIDRKAQQFLLTQFPQWGSGLTNIEDNQAVRKELDALQKNKGKGDLNIYPQAPELILGGEWFNGPPQTLTSLKGKVILVDFWTYTCINCIRTLPYIRTWNEKYKDKGLVIIGVHAPEFEFEKNPNNVKKAIQEYNLTYPVMQDNNFATWRAYENRYWPAKYLIDAQGKIRYTHFGEGEYDKTEEQIQNLLKEHDQSITLGAINNANYKVDTQTPETYLGYARLESINVKEHIATDQIGSYSPALQNPLKNTFDYSGKVLISQEYSNPQSGTKLRLRYDAKNVYLVMKVKKGEGKLKITLDGNIVPESKLGRDVKENTVSITEDRLYNLIEGSKQEEHTLIIEFLDDNVELFAFTFG